MDFIKSPKAIEDKSMDLFNPFIMDIDLTPEEVTVYSRMIHASGDVDYGHLIQTSQGAVAAGRENRLSGGQSGVSVCGGDRKYVRTDFEGNRP